MKYNVLWIDDDYKTQIDFIGEAEQEGIDIHPFESHEEGIAELNKRIDFYHAVILDAKVKKGKSDTVLGLAGLTASRDRLIEINKDGYLPYFIFTGYPDYVDATWFNETFGHYFIKAKDNDSLFQAIKDAVENKEEYIIQRKYKDAFEVCTDMYIGVDAAKTLHNALELIENDNFKISTEDLFNSIRKIIEKIFAAFNRIGVLPDEVFKEKGWINQSSIFLSGKHQSYNLNGEILHPTIAFLLKSILQVIQDASHTEGELRLKVNQHVKDMQTPYLFKSVVFQLLDILIWFKKYADENPNKDINKMLCSSKTTSVSPNHEWIKGTIVNIAGNGYGTFHPEKGGNSVSILPIMMSNYKLKENDTIIVRIELSPDGRKTYIKEITK